MNENRKVTVIGENVRLLRERKGLSQTELGNRVGVVQGSISDLENGRIDKPRFIVELARFFNVTPEQLGTPGFASGLMPNESEHDTLSDDEWALVHAYRSLPDSDQLVHWKAIMRAAAHAAASRLARSSMERPHR